MSTFTDKELIKEIKAASVRMANISRQILVSISVRHGLAVQKRHVKMGGE